jgi:hypothetical protein
MGEAETSKSVVARLKLAGVPGVRVAGGQVDVLPPGQVILTPVVCRQ